MNEENIQKEERSEGVPTTSTETPSTQKSSSFVWILVVLLALAGVAFVAWYTGMFATNEGGEMSVENSAVVATVNGATITRGELDKKIDQVRRSLEPGAPDPTQDASFELQLLEDLINLKLLTMVAEEKNYTVTDDEVEAEKVLLIEQFGGEDMLNEQLEQLGINQDELRESMRDEIMIRQLLEDETDIEGITVSDEEIQATYDMAVGDSEDAPPLDEVKELIRSELVNQKTVQIVEAYINEVRAEAEIEKSL